MLKAITALLTNAGILERRVVDSSAEKKDGYTASAKEYSNGKVVVSFQDIYEEGEEEFSFNREEFYSEFTSLKAAVSALIAKQAMRM